MVFAFITIIVHVTQAPSSTVSHLFGTQLFWSLVIPILVTYATWLVVSMLFFSPWHMFTSVGDLLDPFIMIPVCENHAAN